MYKNVSDSSDAEEDQFQRTRMLLGNEAADKLKKSHVIIFGVGGVGGYTAEAIARSGVGRISLVDRDTVILIFICYDYCCIADKISDRTNREQQMSVYFLFINQNKNAPFVVDMYG